MFFFLDILYKTKRIGKYEAETKPGIEPLCEVDQTHTNERTAAVAPSQRRARARRT